MTNLSKRVEGSAEEIGGKIKSGVGKLLGNKQMESEGKARVRAGKAKQQVAKDADREKAKS